MSHSPYIYAIGQIEPRFPSLDVEKEFQQVTSNPKAISIPQVQDRPPSPDPKSAIQIGIVTASVNVRPKPSLEYPAISQMQQGTSLFIFGEPVLGETLKGSYWFHIGLSADKAVGYIHADLIQVTSATSTHTVKPGENLFTIAMLYGVEWEEIAAANQLSSPRQVYPGQTLTIPRVIDSSRFTQIPETQKLTDKDTFYQAIRTNRYLAREIRWVFTISGFDTYVIEPRSSIELLQLIESTNPMHSLLEAEGHTIPGFTRRDLIIGDRSGQLSTLGEDGVQLPVVTCDRVYSFKIPELLDSAMDGLDEKFGGSVEQTAPEVDPRLFAQTLDEVFNKIQSLMDNTGNADEHRALNYLAVRDPRVYWHTAKMFGDDQSLTEIKVHPLDLGINRNIVDVILKYSHRKTSVVEQYYVRVDVTGEWPFIARATLNEQTDWYTLQRHYGR